MAGGGGGLPQRPTGRRLARFRNSKMMHLSSNISHSSPSCLRSLTGGEEGERIAHYFRIFSHFL